jgi:hypothetical protein
MYMLVQYLYTRDKDHERSYPADNERVKLFNTHARTCLAANKHCACQQADVCVIYILR